LPRTIGDSSMRRAINTSAPFSERRIWQRTALLVVLVFGNLSAAGGQTASSHSQGGQVTTLADSLARTLNTQLHIFYVHGMAFEGPNHSDSALLRKSICKFLRDCTTPAGEFEGREYADRNTFALNAPPPQLAYLGQPIWNGEEWNAAAPFVDHWKLARNKAPTIYIDEINWWPLVFAVKCRQIIAKDAELIGPSATYIDSCSSSQPDTKTSGRYLSYPWIDASEAQRLKALPARAALLNRKLKDYVLDWGFTDAVLAVGPMQKLFLEGIGQVVLKSVRVAADGSRGSAVEPAPNQEFVIVSHSLGSYLIFSALDLDLNKLGNSQMKEWKVEFERILGRTSTVFFFANQLRLLELANLDITNTTNIVEHLETWGKLRRRYLDSLNVPNRNALAPPQIVAWGDPSDLLTWNVPELTTVVVKNQSVKNAAHWFWVLESPTGAHGNYAMNKRVIRAMLKPTNDGKAQ